MLALTAASTRRKAVVIVIEMDTPGTIIAAIVPFPRLLTYMIHNLSSSGAKVG
jgi:hypothetical protein